MFGALKNSHNASKFGVKLGLAYNWMDDAKVPIWVGEAYTCYKKVRAGGGDRICWTAEDATKFALWLSAISQVIAEPALLHGMAEMHEYFTERSIHG